MTQEVLVPLTAPPTDDGSQWRAQTMQVVNWGGFHSHHTLNLANGSTLMSGASGTGKSTLLDAYLALMMPSDTPFNGASNDATAGRARSADQRNLLTYLRGKTDAGRVDGGDEYRDQVLRGADGAPTWGAIAMTFVTQSGRRYTVARAFYVKSGASTNSEVSTTFIARDGHLDLAALEPLAAQRFEKRALRAAFPEVRLFDTYREFEQHLHTRLGIGANGDGRKALRLLARVQAGMTVRSVDSLYKQMVLEQPVTYARADHAIAHFADLERSYRKMQDEAEKEKTLSRLPDLQADLAGAESESDLLDQFGIHREGEDTPFLLWRLVTERVLLDDAVVTNRSAHREATERRRDAISVIQALEARQAEIRQEKAENGGDAIERLTREIDALTVARDEVYRKSVDFQVRTKVLGVDVPESASEFATLRQRSEEFLRTVTDRLAQAEAEVDTVRQRLYPRQQGLSDLQAERASLENRNGMVPRRLHEARAKMAAAAGLDPLEDLPFVAELLDVLPDEETWRTAVETTLGGIARVVLVDQNRREHLSRSIDGMRFSPRIRFDAVALRPHADRGGNDPDKVSGKVAYKASQFSAAVHQRITGSETDHLCVPNATALSQGSGPRVTPSGQTRNGSRGAHGHSGEGPIIGFSNERRLADLDENIAEAISAITALGAEVNRLKRVTDRLRECKSAHQYVLDTPWSSIDVSGADAEIARAQEAKAQVLASSDVLAALEKEEGYLVPRLEQTRDTRALAENRAKELDADHAGLCDNQDTIGDAVEKIEREQTTTLTEEQRQHLDRVFATNWDAGDLSRFHENVRALRSRLAEASVEARRRAEAARRSMRGMFEAFQGRWPDPNLGVAPASAEQYREILDRIVATGLHERRNQWRAQIADWSSDDLVPLNEAFDSAVEDIRSRLDPVNTILAGLPFGDRKGHLQIQMRALGNEDVRKFRQALRRLASGLAEERTEAETEAWFKRLQEFMSRITIPEGHTKSSTSQRDKYLDVRQQVMITAVCQDDNGREIASYNALGGKSGGETQELVAFIVGAALRFQLGDEDRDRPRFAPVFLDEGFVKSDSEFAGRAVTAWQKLGFQLVIGAPLDKVSALERHMDLMVGIVKNSRFHAFLTELRDALPPVGT